VYKSQTGNHVRIHYASYEINVNKVFSPVLLSFFLPLIPAQVCLLVITISLEDNVFDSRENDFTYSPMRIWRWQLPGTVTRNFMARF